MNKNQKFLLVFIGFCMVMIVILIAYNVLMPKQGVSPDDIDVSQRSVEEEPAERPKEQAKEYVNIYFIGRNSHNEEVYKAVKRVYNKDVDGSKIRFAISSLILGPRPEEKQRGVYTEIPAGAELINMSEQPDKVIINLNSSYVYGGGADSLYKRLYQLIKTARLNTSLPVYLYIDGQKADVVGGEGIMISQPLTDSSLEN